jgi:hypothetical protein
MSAHFTDYPGATYRIGTSFRYAIGLSALSSCFQGLMILKTPPVAFARLRSSTVPCTMASVAASGSARAARTSLRRMIAEARRWLPSPRHVVASCPPAGTEDRRAMPPTRSFLHKALPLLGSDLVN